MNTLKELYLYIFDYSPKKVVQIGSVTKRGKKPASGRGITNKQVRKSEKKDQSDFLVSIAMVMTYVMAALMVISLIAVIVFGFFLQDQDTPTIFSDIIIAGMGYFGGSIASFYKSRQ